MRKQSELPEEILTNLQGIGIDPLQIVCFAPLDLTTEGKFRDGYLVLAKDRLALIEDANCAKETRYFRGYKLPDEETLKDWEITCSPLSDIDRMWVQQNVGCDCVYLKKSSGEELIIGMSTHLHKKALIALCKAEGVLAAGGVYEAPQVQEEYCPKCGRMYPESQRKICPHCMDRKSIFVRVLGYFKPYRMRFALMFLATVLTSVVGLVLPYLNGTILYDKILAKDSAFLESIGIQDGSFVTALFLLVLLMVVTNIIQLLLSMLQGVMTAQMVVNVVRDMKKDVFRVMGKLSISFFKNRQTGGLMTRVMSDADRITEFFVDGLPWILIHGFTTMVSLIVMIRMSFSMSVVTILMFPVLVIVSMVLRPRIWIMHGKRHRAERTINSALNDNLTGARVVKSFGQEAKENVRFDKANNNLRDRDIDITYRQNYFRFVYGAAQSIATMGAWFVGVYLLLGRGESAINLGFLLTFVGYVSQMEGPMNFFSRLHNWWADSMNASQRMFEIIDAVPEVVESENPVILGQMKGDIKISGMTFGYDSSRPVLKNINLDIPGGKMYGIVGRSGAGKTTLVNLISRMYDPQEGEITIDGVNVKDLSFEELRKNVAMVSQDTYIFAGTVAENIAYAKKDADTMDVLRAAKLAGAHEFIMRMPDGYDTRIGASGRDLSGGEKQRISIARAILANPKILILDEATASVDTQTERVIQKSLSYLIQGRTTISIAHRLSTLKDADYLVVLDNGEITERGTHEELKAYKGTYYKLLELQTKALERQGETLF